MKSLSQYTDDEELINKHYPEDTKVFYTKGIFNLWTQKIFNVGDIIAEIELNDKKIFEEKVFCSSEVKCAVVDEALMKIINF